MAYEINMAEFEMLVEASKISDAEILEDYSGRNMYGKECIAIIYDNNEQLSDICEFLSENGATKLALSIATKWKTDNMGKGFVKYNY